MTGAQFWAPRAVITGATGGGCGRKKIRERTTEAAASVAVFLFHQQMVLILVVLVADTIVAGHSPNTLGRWSYWWSNHAIVWTVSHPTSTHFYDEIMNFLHVLFYIDSFLSNFRLQVLRKHEWLMGLSSLYLLRFSLRVEEVSNLLLLWKLLCINNILYAS